MIDFTDKELLDLYGGAGNLGGLRAVIAADRERQCSELARKCSELDALSASVPEGWVLVPTEITEPMLNAARRGVDYGDGVGLEHINKVNMRRWKAMLAAAPLPEISKCD